ncbi:hypothetical protein CFP56_014340 [Quercus suber]|uniref:DUF4283 domain-containing protein n=1 Tax=Quercus suber TaxID=58331 RepID=A0AAW0KSC7_QUESU
MAEDVIDSLENMKLTVEEEEIIALNKRAAMNTLWRRWGMHTGLQIIEVGTNLFQFKFQNDFDLNRVLRGGPWYFDNQLLMLKRWHKGMTAICVALPISKPLRREGFIADLDGVHTWVKFKYERLPIFCHFCGLLGHDLHHCASHYVVEKNGGDVKYQYGDWLKASDEGSCRI